MHKTSSPGSLISRGNPEEEKILFIVIVLLCMSFLICGLFLQLCNWSDSFWSAPRYHCGKYSKAAYRNWRKCDQWPDPTKSVWNKQGKWCLSSSVSEELYCSWIYWLLIKIFDAVKYQEFCCIRNSMEYTENILQYQKNTWWGWRPVLVPQNTNFVSCPILVSFTLILHFENYMKAHAFRRSFLLNCYFIFLV